MWLLLSYLRYSISRQCSRISANADVHSCQRPLGNTVLQRSVHSACAVVLPGSGARSDSLGFLRFQRKERKRNLSSYATDKPLVIANCKCVHELQYFLDCCACARLTRDVRKNTMSLPAA